MRVHQASHSLFPNPFLVQLLSATGALLSPLLTRMSNELVDAFCVVAHNLKYFNNHGGLNYERIYDLYVELIHSGDHSDIDSECEADFPR